MVTTFIRLKSGDSFTAIDGLIYTKMDHYRALHNATETVHLFGALEVVECAD